jgi:DNA-binding transcriptional MocR family regulator
LRRYEEYFAWVPPRAGAVAFLKFKGGLTSEQLGQEMAAAGIGMKPAYCFTPEVTDDVDFFRVGYGEEVMPEALDKFAEFVEANKHRWQIKDRSR